MFLGPSRVILIISSQQGLKTFCNYLDLLPNKFLKSSSIVFRPFSQQFSNAPAKIPLLSLVWWYSLLSSLEQLAACQLFGYSYLLLCDSLLLDNELQLYLFPVFFSYDYNNLKSMLVVSLSIQLFVFHKFHMLPGK